MRKTVVSSLLISLALGCLAAVAARGQSPAPAGAEMTAPAIAPSVIAAAQAKLAQQLMEKLDKPADDTITLSPGSLASALTLLDLGADPGMRAAMAQVLGLGAPASSSAVFAVLDAARKSWKADASGMIQSADKIVLDPLAERYPVSLPGLAALGADVSVEDLSRPETIARINDWVKGVTQGLVPRILDGPLDSAAFVALNALHFKGRWQTSFDPDRTRPARFTDANGKSAEVAMMHLLPGRYALRTDNDFVGIDLPFAGDRFSLVVVTTRSGPAKLAAFDQVSGWLAGDGFSEQQGELALPRMSLAGREELLPALDAMGLAAARNNPTALGGFAIGANLARIVQSATLDVTEEGAEAAAATAIVTTRSASPDNRIISMIVDKPFVYALRDRQTGLIVVAGYVGRAPRGKTS